MFAQCQRYNDLRVQFFSQAQYVTHMSRVTIGSLFLLCQALILKSLKWLVNL